MFLVAQDEKCGSCNWRVANLYMMGETKKDAMEAYKENDRGLCGDCMCEMLSERNYQITKLESKCPECRKPFEVVALAMTYKIVGCPEHREFDRVKRI